MNGGEVTRYATAPVERGDLQATLSGTGALQPVGRRAVIAGVAGTVADVLVREGDHITKGQLLARIDSTSIQGDVARAEALIEARESELAKAAENEQNAQDQLRRFEHVRRQSEGRVPSDRELVQARDDLRRASDGLRDAMVELDAARTSLLARQAQLAATDIRAPANGQMLRWLVGPGRQVAAYDSPLFEIVEPPTRLRMDVMVERAAARTLRNGATAQVTAAAAPHRTFAATVVQVRPARSADGTRSILSLDISNPDLTLRSGMTGVVSISLGLRENALVAPEAALRFARASDAAESDGSAPGAAVYVLGERGIPRRMPVTLDGGDGRRHAVVSPALQPGMPVITGLR